VSFSTWEAGEQWVQEWAKARGWAIKRSTGKLKEGRGPTRLKKFFTCDKAGKERTTSVPDEFRKRKRTRSKITNCPARLSFSQQEPGGLFYLQIQCEQYNYPPSLRPLDHAAHRRIERMNAPEITQKIKSDLIAKIQPKKILNSLKDSYPNILLKLRDIYNLDAGFKVLFDHGLPPI
jgi:hypothetical protein